jgi:hypothetical protein
MRRMVVVLCCELDAGPDMPFITLARASAVPHGDAASLRRPSALLSFRSHSTQMSDIRRVITDILYGQTEIDKLNSTHCTKPWQGHPSAKAGAAEDG